MLEILTKYYDYVSYNYINNALIGIGLAGFTILTLLLTAYAFKLNIVASKMPKLLRRYYTEKTINYKLIIYICVFSIIVIISQLFFEGISMFLIIVFIMLFALEIILIVIHICKQYKEVSISNYFQRKYNIDYKKIQKRYKKQQEERIKTLYNKKVINKNKKLSFIEKEYTKTFDVINDLYSILNDELSYKDPDVYLIINIIFTYWHNYKCIIKYVNPENDYSKPDNESNHVNYLNQNPFDFKNQFTNGLEYLTESQSQSVHFINLLKIYFDKNIFNNNYINILMSLKLISKIIDEKKLYCFDPSDMQFINIINELINYKGCSKEIISLIIEINQKISITIENQNNMLVSFSNSLNNCSQIKKVQNFLIEELLYHFRISINKEEKIYNRPITPIEYYKSLLFSQLCRRNKSFLIVFNNATFNFIKNEKEKLNICSILRLQLMMIDRNIQLLDNYESNAKKVVDDYLISWEINKNNVTQEIVFQIIGFAAIYKDFKFELSNNDDFINFTYVVYMLDKIVTVFKSNENFNKQKDLLTNDFNLFVCNVLSYVISYSILRIGQISNTLDGEINDAINLIRIAMVIYYKYDCLCGLKETLIEKSIEDYIVNVLNASDNLKKGKYGDYLENITKDIADDEVICFIMNPRRNNNEEINNKIKKYFQKEKSNI